MACPYFYPVERVRTDPWAGGPRMPLGAEYRGLCRAEAAAEREPGEETRSACCNSGYARGACEFFPAGGGPDAVRLSMLPGAGQDGRFVLVLEKEHSPAGVWRFEYRDGELHGEFPDATARRQATVFAEQFGRGPRGLAQA